MKSNITNKSNLYYKHFNRVLVITSDLLVHAALLDGGHGFVEASLGSSPGLVELELLHVLGVRRDIHVPEEGGACAAGLALQPW